MNTVDKLNNTLGYLTTMFFERPELSKNLVEHLNDLSEAIAEVENLVTHDVSFELPSDDIFDVQEVDLKNPLEEFYYYERPVYLKDDQQQFRERLQKALNYLKDN